MSVAAVKRRVEIEQMASSRSRPGDQLGKQGAADAATPG
jgi:hypothetical protein